MSSQAQPIGRRRAVGAAAPIGSTARLRYGRGVLEQVFTRRALLCAGGAVSTGLLAGCYGSTGPQPDRLPPATSSAPSSDLALITAAAKSELLLLAQAQLVIKQNPTTEAKLADLQHNIEAHLRWLRTLAPASSRSLGFLSYPHAPRSALHSLIKACSDAAEQRLEQCVQAQAGPLAQIFASMAASHSVTVELLRTGR